MTPTKNVAIAPELLERADKVAEEGKTVDELTTEALQRDLARRWLGRIGREGQIRRGSMSDDEVEAVVERAVQESRAGQRER